MTPAETDDARVCILVDEWPDGYIESWAWVKVTTLTDTPEKALAKLQRQFPVDEQGDGGEQMMYVVRGQVYKRPIGVPDAHGVVTERDEQGNAIGEWHWPEVPWPDCAKGEQWGEPFWKVEAVHADATEKLAKATDA